MAKNRWQHFFQTDMTYTLQIKKANIKYLRNGPNDETFNVNLANELQILNHNRFLPNITIFVKYM